MAKKPITEGKTRNIQKPNTDKASPRPAPPPSISDAPKNDEVETLLMQAFNKIEKARQLMGDSNRQSDWVMNDAADAVELAMGEYNDEKNE